MKITERRLRSIIRETLLEEQNRIDESAKDAITKGLMALMMTHGTSAVVNMANHLTQGEIGRSISDPLSGSPKSARGHRMTAAEEAEIDAFIKNPTRDELFRMKELTRKLYRSFGAGRQGSTPEGDPYKDTLRKAAAAIEKVEEKYKIKSAAMYSLD